MRGGGSLTSRCCFCVYRCVVQPYNSRRLPHPTPSGAPLSERAFVPNESEESKFRTPQTEGLPSPTGIVIYFLKKVLTFSSKFGMIQFVPNKWGYSSAGRALEWHSRGQRSDPAYLHQENSDHIRGRCFLF